MARISLPGHWKFRRLVRNVAGLQPCALVGAEPVARGMLELLWEAGYNAVSAYVGTPTDVADAVAWRGEPLELVALLVDAGFLDERTPGEYVIHDLWSNAPRYAQLRYLAKHPGQAPPWRPAGVERETITADARNSELKSELKSELNSELKSELKSESNAELNSELKSTYPRPGQASPGIGKGSAARASRPTDNGKPEARKLVPLGYELVRLGQRFTLDADLKAAMAELAARENIPYDSSSMADALDALKHARAPLWKGNP